MSTNDQILLNEQLAQLKNERYPEASDDEFFTYFSAEQILKNYELSDEEILDGVVDGSGDGGIDAIYVFINEELVHDDTVQYERKRDSKIDVIIIQAKNARGFQEKAIENFISSTRDLFDLSKNTKELIDVYNEDLIRKVTLFRETCSTMASRFPKISISFYYASKGLEIHPNVNRKVDALKTEVSRQFNQANFNFEFVTASKLIEYSRANKISTAELILNDTPISTEDGGYIALVQLPYYYSFLVDKKGDLINSFFDANIRDYQGDNLVNKAIAETLNSKEKEEDFWWLNNGVTITTTEAIIMSKKIHIKDPQIVNGLQTSYLIYKYFKEIKDKNDKRSILVRIVKPANEKSRLKVIKATNSQTQIPPTSIISTDTIHRDIEEYLLTKGYFYDRRKNYYKNQNKPINKIISIPLMAQIVISILDQKPNYSRARPATLLNNRDNYERIFSSKYSLDFYYKSTYLYGLVDKYLENNNFRKLTKLQKGDIKFHVLTYLSVIASKVIKPNEEQIARLDLNEVTPDLIIRSIQFVFQIYIDNGGTNKYSKSQEFVDAILDSLQNALR